MEGRAFPPMVHGGGVRQITTIVGGNVWTGDGGDASEPATIRIVGDRVVAVDPPSDMPAESTGVLRADGCTIIPGMADAHAHLATNSDYDTVAPLQPYMTHAPSAARLIDSYRNALFALRAGFTSLRVMGHRGVDEVELRKAIDSGLLFGPRMKVSPWAITATGGHGDMFFPKKHHRVKWDTVDGADQCRALVRLQRREGADFIKMMASGGTVSHGDDPHAPEFSLKEMKAIISAAHDLGIKVAAHSHAAAGIRRAVEAGVDSIEHGSFMGAQEAAMMAAAGTALVPTFSIGAWLTDGEDRGVGPSSDTREGSQRGREALRHAIDAGVLIVAGTDAGGNVCPFGHHARELELYVEAGMSSADALRTATVNAARLFGTEDQLGSITPGKLADLVVVAGDPLQDIGVLRRGSVRNVILGGQDITDNLDAALPARGRP